MKYDVVYADPAWMFSNTKTGGSMGSGAAQQYEVMSTAAIAALPVAACCQSDALLGLWSTVPMLPDALRVMEAWGFTYKTADFWIKARLESPRAALLVKAIASFLQNGPAFDGLGRLRRSLHDALEAEEAIAAGRIGMGFWLRGNVEILLIGARGNVTPPRLALRNFHISEAGEHSAKPAEARKRLALMASTSIGGNWQGVELFAREASPGFKPVGLSIDGRRVEQFLHDASLEVW